MKLLHEFDHFMQRWYVSNHPWSDIILGVVGLAMGAGLAALGCYLA